MVLIGNTIARDRIVSRLGKGGMGEVYLAVDTRLGRKVALKVLPADLSSDPARLKRFELEANTVAGISHPNIVTLHSVGEHQGIRFLTMGRVEGQGLNQVVATDGLPLPQVFEIGAAVADALAAAQDKGLRPRRVRSPRPG